MAATAKGVDPLKSATGDLTIGQVISAREDQEKLVNSNLRLMNDRVDGLKESARGPMITKYLTMSTDPDYPIPALDRRKLKAAVESGDLPQNLADTYEADYDSWLSSVEPIKTNIETARQQVTIFKKMENAMVPFLKQERQALKTVSDEDVISQVLSFDGYSWNPETQKFTSPKGNIFGLETARNKILSLSKSGS